MESTTGEEMARDITDWVMRTTPHERKMFVKYIVENVHRTVQQRFMSVIVDLLGFYSSLTPGMYDQRNEATVKLCKEIGAVVDDKFFKLPYI